MKNAWRANIAIEAAVILPLIIMMFAGMVTVLFYYHDKNIVIGAAYEIATVGSRETEPSKEDLGKQLQERLDRKLILFHRIYVDIWMEDSEVAIRCQSSKNGLHLSVQVSMSRTCPEKYIRVIRNIEKLEEKAGEL